MREYMEPIRAIVSAEHFGSSERVGCSCNDSEDDRHDDQQVCERSLKEEKREQLFIASESGCVYGNRTIDKTHQKHDVDADPSYC